MRERNRPLLTELGAASIATAVLALTGVLGLATASPAAAEEHEERRVVRRPLVVVQSEESPYGYTWTVGGHRSFLGVQTVDLTTELRRHFGAPDDAGVMVAKIVDDSPAAANDLRVGDIITKLDGEAIGSPAELARAVRRHETGDVVELEVYRDGAPLGVQTTLAERQGVEVDIRQFHFPEGHLEGFAFSDEELEGAIQLRTETLDRALERLNEEMASPEWHQRLHSVREHQSALMDRIEELEKRLREMEVELRRLESDER